MINIKLISVFVNWKYYFFILFFFPPQLRFFYREYNFFNDPCESYKNVFEMHYARFKLGVQNFTRTMMPQFFNRFELSANFITVDTNFYFFFIFAKTDINSEHGF